jgi:hypothetical protein
LEVETQPPALNLSTHCYDSQHHPVGLLLLYYAHCPHCCCCSFSGLLSVELCPTSCTQIHTITLIFRLLPHSHTLLASAAVSPLCTP